MSDWFSSALPWYGWWALAMVPPAIILLYFLKLRRTPLEVPSTYLWTRTIEDLHVNSIWQRLRNSLLLLLQLLLAFLLLFACLQPGCEGEELAGNRFIFLIDNSASMAAQDLENGQTRFEFAKSEIRKLIDAMNTNASAMIISFSNESDVVQSYTRNKSQLKRALENIRQTERDTDMMEALIAASGLANPGRTSDRESEIDIQVADALKAKMYIFSDGAVVDAPEFALGNLKAEYRPIGSQEIPFNLGITAFSISREFDSESGVQAFVRIQNSDDQDHNTDISLYAGDELFDAKSEISIPSQNSTVMSFDLTPLVTNLEQSIDVKVQIDVQDSLPTDNTAYGVIEPPRKINVLICSPGNEYLDLVVQTQRIRRLANVDSRPSEFLASEDFAKASALGEFDMMIFDRCTPNEMPPCNTMFIGAIPPSEDWQAGESEFPTTIIDMVVTHPILNAVTMSNVIIVESTPLTGPAGTISLMDATFGSVMAISPREGFQDLVLGFTLIELNNNEETIVNSDWPFKLSFPLFMQNSLSWLGGASRFSTNSGTKPGELIRFRSRSPAESVLVINPAGRQTKLLPQPDRGFVYAEAEGTGIYVVQNSTDQSTERLLAVNLLDARESDLTVREKLNVGYEEIGATTETIPARREFWPWMIAAALIVLMVEWHVYNRRVFI